MTIQTRFSSSFRQAMSLSALFACTMIVVFSAIYVSIGIQLRGSLERAVDSDLGELLADWDRGGFEELRNDVQRYADVSSSGHSLFVLQQIGGDPIAGNAQGLRPIDGRRVVRRAQIEMNTPAGDVDDTDSFYIDGVVLDGDYYVAVGYSDHDITETQEILITAFTAGLVATTLLSLTVGALLGRRVQLRIRRIREALERVANGDFAQPIPGSDTNDDVGEVVRLVNRTTNRLRIVMESIQQISNDIAHDLKRPIGRLQRRLRAASVGLEAGKDVRKILTSALDQTSEILRIFEALLRIAQIESGARRAQFRAVDLHALVASLHETFEPVANAAGRRLILAADEQSSLVNGDEELLTQLFVNLIENAIRFTHAGGQIMVGVRAETDGVKAWVADNGPGIPEAEREAVTRRFYRLDKSRSLPGDGLGLSLVAAVAALHHASLEFTDNRPGLMVSVFFPNDAVDEVRAAQKSAQQ